MANTVGNLLELKFSRVTRRNRQGDNDHGSAMHRRRRRRLVQKAVRWHECVKFAFRGYIRKWESVYLKIIAAQVQVILFEHDHKYNQQCHNIKRLSGVKIVGFGIYNQRYINPFKLQIITYVKATKPHHESLLFQLHPDVIDWRGALNFSSVIQVVTSVHASCFRI